MLFHVEVLDRKSPELYPVGTSKKLPATPHLSPVAESGANGVPVPKLAGVLFLIPDAPDPKGPAIFSFCTDPGQLAACFAGKADYLFQPDKLNADFDSGDRTFQCARRIDVLKLWLAWQHHGDVGFAARIDHAVEMADHARARIAASNGAFVPLVSATFTNVVFVWIPEDDRPLDFAKTPIPALPAERFDRLHALPPAIKAQMQAAGTAMVGFQPIDGLNAFRMLFMNPAVTTADVDVMLDLIADYGQAAVGHTSRRPLDAAK